MIIIEGPDGAGKTHLARQLQEITGLKIHHWGKPPENADELAANLKRSKQMTREPVIQERTPWITEPIYDVAKNGGNRIDTCFHYVRTLLLLKTPVIYCRPPLEVVKRGATINPTSSDMPEYSKWVEENIENIIGLYDQFMEITKPAMTYDWTKHDLSQKLDRIVRLINKHKLLVDIRSSLKANLRVCAKQINE